MDTYSCHAPCSKCFRPATFGLISQAEVLWVTYLYCFRVVHTSLHLPNNLVDPNHSWRFVGCHKLQAYCRNRNNFRENVNSAKYCTSYKAGSMECSIDLKRYASRACAYIILKSIPNVVVNMPFTKPDITMYEYSSVWVFAWQSIINTGYHQLHQ